MAPIPTIATQPPNLLVLLPPIANYTPNVVVCPRPMHRIISFNKCNSGRHEVSVLIMMIVILHIITTLTRSYFSYNRMKILVDPEPTSPLVEQFQSLSLHEMDSSERLGTIRFTGTLYTHLVKVLMDGSSNDNFI